MTEDSTGKQKLITELPSSSFFSPQPVRFTSFIVSPDGTSTDKNALTEAMEKAANTVENEAAGDNVGEDTKGSEDALTKEGGAGCCTIM